ncbi:MAG: MATE family efflux transporter, partial [Oliverpabstia sp.]|nr:MATE family efflux transporter [Oliverpabstia sp.]
MEKEIKEKAEVRQGDMTEGPILKQLIMFALPLFIGALFQLMYNMTDSIILGKFVGADALAAIGATNT